MKQIIIAKIVISDSGSKRISVKSVFCCVRREQNQVCLRKNRESRSTIIRCISFINDVAVSLSLRNDHVVSPSPHKQVSSLTSLVLSLSMFLFKFYLKKCDYLK